MKEILGIYFYELYYFGSFWNYLNVVIIVVGLGMINFFFGYKFFKYDNYVFVYVNIVDFDIFEGDFKVLIFLFLIMFLFYISYRFGLSSFF